MNDLKRSQRRPIGQGGFTLIELIIVVAVISIVAALAVPLHANEEARARVHEQCRLCEGTSLVSLHAIGRRSPSPRTKISAERSLPAMAVGIVRLWVVSSWHRGDVDLSTYRQPISR